MSDTGKNVRETALFLLIAFAWSWAIGAALWRFGWMTPEGAGLHTVAGLVLYMCGPAIAALICAARFDAGRRAEALGFRSPLNTWILAAWLAPIAVTGGALVFTLAFSDRAYQPMTVALDALLRAQGKDPSDLPLSLSALAAIQFASAAVLGPLINAPLLLSEELGWRGWLWSRWSRLGFWRNVGLTGFVWGLWHAPIIALGHNYPGMPVSGPFLMIGFSLLLCPLLHFVRERGGSVWHAALFHGTLNAFGPLSLLLVSDASMPWRGIVGAGGFAALAVATVGVAIARAGLSRRA